MTVPLLGMALDIAKRAAAETLVGAKPRKPEFGDKPVDCDLYWGNPKDAARIWRSRYSDWSSMKSRAERMCAPTKFGVFNCGILLSNAVKTIDKQTGAPTMSPQDRSTAQQVCEDGEKPKAKEAKSGECSTQEVNCADYTKSPYGFARSVDMLCKGEGVQDEIIVFAHNKCWTPKERMLLDDVGGAMDDKCPKPDPSSSFCESKVNYYSFAKSKLGDKAESKACQKNWKTWCKPSDAGRNERVAACIKGLGAKPEVKNCGNKPSATASLIDSDEMIVWNKCRDENANFNKNLNTWNAGEKRCKEGNGGGTAPTPSDDCPSLTCRDVAPANKGNTYGKIRRTLGGTKAAKCIKAKERKCICKLNTDQRRTELGKAKTPEAKDRLKTRFRACPR